MASSLTQLNPYQSPTEYDRCVTAQIPHFDLAEVQLLDRSLLLRKIYISDPFDAILCWNGRRLKEVVTLNGQVMAHGYSATYTPRFQFQFMNGSALHWLKVEVDIFFLFVQRFQIYLDSQLIYSEQL